MSKKMSKMLDEVGTLLTAASNLQMNYHNCVHVLQLVSQDTSRRAYDLNMIRATELQMNQDHQALCLQLMNFQSQYEQYCLYGVSPAHHMNLLVLAEEIGSWTDRYNAVVVGPAITLMSHVESAPLTV